MEPKLFKKKWRSTFGSLPKRFPNTASIFYRFLTPLGAILLHFGGFLHQVWGSKAQISTKIRQELAKNSPRTRREPAKNPPSTRPSKKAEKKSGAAVFPQRGYAIE